MKYHKEKLLLNAYKALSLRAPHEFLERVFRILSKEFPIDVAIAWIIGYRYKVSYQWVRSGWSSKIEDIDKEAEKAFETEEDRAALFLQLNPSIRDAIISEQSLYIPDLSKARDYGGKLVIKHGLRSALIMPLITEGDEKVVLCIMSSKINAFGRQERSFLNKMKKGFSAVSTIWLYENKLKRDNEALKKNIKEKTYELQVLYELSRKLGYTLSYDELLRLMAQHLYRAMKYDVVATLLAVGDTEKLVIYPARKLSDRLKENIQTELTEAFYKLGGKKLSRLQVLYKQLMDKEGAEIESLGSVFQVPIMVTEELKVIGLIFIGAEKEEAFTEEQIRLIYTIAHHASESIQRLRNLIDLEQRRLETILDFMREGIILLDKNKTVVYANPKGMQYIAELSGADQGEVLNRLGYVSVEQLLSAVPKGQWHVLSIAKPELRIFEVGTRPVEEGPEQGGWIMVLREVTEQRKFFIKYRKALEGAISALATAIGKRDPYTAGHQRRVAELAKAIAREMRLSEDKVQCVYMAALLHDVGKISIPSEILSKPQRLNKPEYQMMKFHPIVAHEILKDIDFPWPVNKAILYHHERIDGSGYPNGLKGSEIPLEAKILAVADVVEAISSHRPYRPALGVQAALEEIEKNKGKLYDPDVADACIRLFKEGRFQLKEQGQLYIKEKI